MSIANVIVKPKKKKVTQLRNEVYILQRLTKVKIGVWKRRVWNASTLILNKGTECDKYSFLFSCTVSKTKLWKCVVSFKQINHKISGIHLLNSAPKLPVPCKNQQWQKISEQEWTNEKFKTKINFLDLEHRAVIYNVVNCSMSSDQNICDWDVLVGKIVMMRSWSIIPTCKRC